MQKINSPDGLFHDGNPATGTVGTIVTAVWLNAVGGELENMVIGLGGTLDSTKNDQIKTLLLAALENKSSKANTLAGYGITDAYTKAETDGKLAGKADKTSSLSGYGITDAYTKTETDGKLTGKADKATTLAGYGITDGATTTQVIAAAPPGEVAYFAMSTPPPGWLECRGSLISRTTYAALFAAIGTTFGAGDGSTTFELPDLRGEFLRVWDNGRGVDTGRAFGSAQSGIVGPHVHTIIRPTDNAPLALPPGSAAGAWSYGTTVYSSDQATLVTGSSSGIGTETRPRNIALIACIKL